MEEILEDQGSQSSNSTLTGFIVLHGFLLKILEYIQPELLFQAITVVSKKALQTISVGEHKSVKSGLSFFTCKTEMYLHNDELQNRLNTIDYHGNGKYSLRKLPFNASLSGSNITCL